MNQDQHQENHYRKLCEKLNEEIYLLEKMLKKKIQKIINKKKSNKLDPVGKEDEDVDNDGKKNTSSDKYIKARREKISQEMKKKKMVNEGYSITDGNIFYGGFPRILKKNGLRQQYINESKEMRIELEKYLDALSSHGEKLHKSNHPDRTKYGKTLIAFTKGNYNNADELISMGADPTAVGEYIAINKNPEYQKHMKQMFATVDPSMGGIYGND